MQNDSAPAFFGQRHGVTLAVMALVLFYLVHNVGTVFFQARGVPAGQGAFALFGYFSGIAAGVAGFSLLERRPAWTSPGSAGAALRGILLTALLVPGVFCLVSLSLVGYGGSAFLNFFQPMMWAAMLPVSFRFFLRNVPPACWALYFGMAVGAGHVCWSLLTPLVSVFSPSSLLDGQENRFLFFLNTSRALLSFALAFVCWKLAGLEKRASPSNALSPCGVEKGCRILRFPSGRFWLLLAPFLACFFFNGFLQYLFFPRLVGRGLYPEYMHLFLAAAFPLAGFQIWKRGETLLPRLAMFACAAFSLLPLLLYASVPDYVRQAVLFTCSAASQILLFCGVLVFARFSRGTRDLCFAASTVWFAAAVSIPGNILAARLETRLPEGLLLFALITACLFSLVLFYRGLPLPSLPAPFFPLHPWAEPEKHTAFIEAYGISQREAEVLDGIINGRSRTDIGKTLGISESTVKFHTRNLLKKTGTSNSRDVANAYSRWMTSS